PTDTDLTTLISEITNMNPELKDLNNDFKILFQIKNPNNTNKTISLALRVSPKAYHIIKTQLHYRIYLHTQCCIIQDKIFIKQCQKCFLFNHRTADCKAKTICKQCGQEKASNHTCSVTCCSNCKKSEKYKSNTNHLPNNINCPMYKTQMQYIQEKTQYQPSQIQT